jgi:CRISPR-associated protein Cmr4
MHVGSGKTNAGIVDNTIQRDVLTELPVINSSSLKGALREYANNNHFPKEQITLAFGRGNEKKNGKEDDKEANTPGKYTFFSAHLLSLPARSNKLPFVNATTCSIIARLVNQIELLQGKDETLEKLKKLSEIPFGEDEKAFCFEESLDGIIVEFYDVKTIKKDISLECLDVLKDWIGANPVIVEEEIFNKDIAGKLPIIARNYLENGQSANLWYEEILPRESILYTFISKPETDDAKINFDGIKLQIGANASVGYGYSVIYQPKKKGGAL